MILILHILIAFSSIFFTGITYLLPSKSKLTISYALVAATLLSGTYLVFTKPSHLMSACITGLIYLGFVSLGIIFAHHKLSRVDNT